MRRAGCLILLVVTALILGGRAAGASATGDVRPLAVEVDGGDALFDLGAVYPGALFESTVRISNRSADAAVLQVSAVDVVGHDGCSPVEVKSGMACGGPGDGHLVDQVELTIEQLLDGAPAVPRWTGPLDELGAVALSPTGIEGGATLQYRFTLSLPRSSGNETQEDGLEFDLRFDLGMDASATVVHGTTVDRAGSGGVSVLGLTLPRTGAELVRTGQVGGAVLLAGIAVVRLARRRVAAVDLP